MFHFQLKLLEVDEKLKTSVKDKIIISREKESLIADFKIRETQLKNLNKVISLNVSP